MSRPGDIIHHVRGRLGGSTGKAQHIIVHAVDETELEKPEDHWFPFSMITSITKQTPGSDLFDILAVKQWILEQKDLAVWNWDHDDPATGAKPTKVDKPLYGSKPKQVIFDDYDDDISF